MTKVLHTGDTHIGYRQYGSDERRDDFLRAFERVVDDAVAGDYDVLVHAGDLFHSRNPRLEDLQATIDLFSRLDEGGVEALGIVGNHESKRDAQWLDLLENLGLVRRLGFEPVVVDGVAFYGVDHTPESRAEGFDYGRFEPTDDAEDTALVLHGLFDPFPFGDWPLEEFVEEVPVDWDVLLLGDYHHPERAEVEGVTAVYSGSTERASTDEEEARGYNVVEFDDGVSVSRRSIETRDFVNVAVELTEASGSDGTPEALDRTREYDMEDAVVIVDVEGHPEPAVVQSEVEESLRDRGALVARVRDKREDGERKTAEVTFADPDEAVRERIEEMELSEAGRELDSLVRGDGVARTNLADEVEERVGGLLDESDVEEEQGSRGEAEEQGQSTVEDW